MFAAQHKLRCHQDNLLCLKHMHETKFHAYVMNPYYEQLSTTFSG